jgi:hypothetical protein
MDFSKKSVKTATWLFVAVFNIMFAIYILNANKVYFFVSGKSYIEKIPDDNSLYIGDALQMLSVVDHPPTNNPFEEGKGFRGQFARVENKKGIAKVRVFFRSADALFELIENRHSFWERAEKTVVNFFASTAGLENGIFQMGLYLSDDRGEKFAWINSFFEKANGGPMEYMARPVAPVLARISEDLKFDIEDFSQRYKKIVFEGWTVLENVDMKGFNAYLLIRDSCGVSKTFYTPLYTRMDLMSKFNDLRAVNCGFRIRIPQSELPPGDYTVSVALKSRKTGEAIESAQDKKINLLPMIRGSSKKIRQHRCQQR